MKVLLVYPEYPVTFWSFKHVLKFMSKQAAYPPLGLLTVAGLLPRDWELRLVDLNIRKLKDTEIEWADYIFISAMLVQQISAEEVIDRCRRLGRKTVAGGPLFTSLADDFSPLVDHLILGEAEVSLPRFLRDLEKGDPQHLYQAESFPPLTDTPVPRWDLLDVKKYATLTVQSSRGCPFNCEFCDITNLFGRVPRVKEAGQLIDELEIIYQMGWRDTVFFVDDNFIGNKKKIKQILPHLVQWMKSHHYPFTFITEASINLASDDELIELMVQANFNRVFIGLETPNEASLRECEKSQNTNLDVMAAIKKLQGRGLQVLGGYIIGFDNDDESIFTRQMNFIQESGVVTAMVGLLNAIPGTNLWKRLNEENRLLLQSSGNNTDGTINFVPKMDVEKLREGYRNLIRTIYSPRHYYQRLCNFLEKYQPRQKRRLKPDDLKAFARTVLYLGILGNGVTQWYYWKLVFRTLTRYPRSFGDAISLMVFGHHFRKVSKKV